MKGQILIALAAVVLFAGCVASSPPETKGDAAAGGGPGSPVVPDIGIRGIPAAEIEKHSTAQDCWVVVEGKVYDVTQIMGTHPNIAKCIIPFCGKDATTSFRSRAHPQSALAVLDGLYVGEAG